MTTNKFLSTLKERGVLGNVVDESSVRMLTHHDVSRKDCLTACEAIRRVAEDSEAETLVQTRHSVYACGAHQGDQLFMRDALQADYAIVQAMFLDRFL